MANQSDINRVLKDFPILADYADMVEFVLDIREAFDLKKVPFEVKVGSWSSGSLKPYYKKVWMERKAARLKNAKPKNQRPPNRPYTRY